MYSCTSCGANLRYDIKTQKLVCDFCGASEEPQDHPDSLLVGKQNEYDVTVYTCPQCGGELYSTGLEAASFCMYCGSSVALEGRLSRETSPKSIIPFRKTADEAKEAYRRKTAGVWFLPKEMKEAEHLEKFQPIYLPYWIYEVEQRGDVSLKGRRTRGRYTEYCNINLTLNADYSFLPHDASSSLDDELSQNVAPFHEEQLTEFSPAYLCGFYADCGDVPDQTYQTDVKEEANDSTFRFISRMSGGDMKGMHVSRPKDETKAFHTRVSGTNTALFPYWFLTWRNNDRVAYSVANGETGRLVADLPVHIPSYCIASFVLSAVIAAVLFFLLPVMQAPTVLMLSAYISCFMLFLFVQNQGSMAERETHAHDKGFLVKHDQEEHNRSVSKLVLFGVVFGILFFVPYLVKLMLGTFNLDMAFASFTTILGAAAWLVICACSAWFLYRAADMQRLLRGKRLLFDTVIGVAALVIAGFVLVLRNPYDLYYYIAIILLLLVILYLIIELIRGYNLLSTRPIPEFHQREGGRENV